jgi:hypothetical protein
MNDLLEAGAEIISDCIDVIMQFMKYLGGILGGDE